MNHFTQYQLQYQVPEEFSVSPNTVKVLVLEEDPVRLEALMGFLQVETEFQVMGFSYREEVLNYLRDKEADILVTDVTPGQPPIEHFLTALGLLKPDLNGLLLSLAKNRAKARSLIRTIPGLQKFRYVEETESKDDFLFALANAAENVFLTNVLARQAQTYQRILADHRNIQREIIKAFV